MDVACVHQVQQKQDSSLKMTTAIPSHSMAVWHDTAAVFGDVDTVLRAVAAVRAALKAPCFPSHDTKDPGSAMLFFFPSFSISEHTVFPLPNNLLTHARK